MHVDVWQKPAQYCKAIFIFQLKITLKKFFPWQRKGELVVKENEHLKGPCLRKYIQNDVVCVQTTFFHPSNMCKMPPYVRH